jgi:hypothetical protein
MFPSQTYVFEEVADNRIQITQSALSGSAHDKASTAMSTHQGSDFADSAIAENDLTSVLIFERFQEAE